MKCNSEALRDRRVAAGLSQNQLTKLCGLPKGIINNSERGLNCLSLKSARIIAAVLGCKVSDIVIPYNRRGTP